MTNSVEELEDAACILIIGSNTTVAHPIIATRIFRAREKGAKIIVVDPRKTHIASYADLYLAEKSGTDVAVINGLLHIIIKEGWYDKEFVEKRTEGFAALQTFLAEYPPARVAEITGIPEAQLRQAAEMFAKAKQGSIVYCMGITQHTVGVDNVLSLANLSMATGHIGKWASGVNPLRGQNNVQGSTDMAAIPNVLPGYQSLADDAVIAKFEAVWGVTLPRKPGLTLMEMMDAIGTGGIRALYVMGENPMVSDPDIQHVKKALESLELLIVQDIFPTETVALAHVVLPAVTFAEKALQPAKVSRVTVLDAAEKQLEVIVDDTQLSLAIGKKGQNVRLAAKLLGWKIDIKSEEEKRQEVEQQMSALVGGQATPLDKVPDMGVSVIEKLQAAGVNSVEELADMTPEQLEAIEGIGPKTVEKISLAVNNYFASLEVGEAAEAAAYDAPEDQPVAGEEGAPLPDGVGPDSAGQSGDTEGLSEIAEAGNESVSELVEEGQDLEAEAISGVENAPNADDAEVTTHERHLDEEQIPPEKT